MQFYTDFSRIGKTTYIRGYDHLGTQRFVEHKEANFPLYATVGNKETSYTNLKGEPLFQYDFKDPREARDFAKDQYDNGIQICGNLKFEYTHIAKMFPDDIKSDSSMLRVAFLDIETTSELGFPQFTNPVEEVNLVTIVYRGKSYTVTTIPYDESNGTIPGKFRRVATERDLFDSLSSLINTISPDVISGWFIEGFDIPYLAARSNVIYGDDSWVRSLSPFGKVKQKQIEMKGKKLDTVDIVGLVILDYQKVYMKHGKKLTDDKLETCAMAHLGRGKHKFEGSFKDQYQKPENWHSFILYNIEDTMLVFDLDKKLQYVGLIMKLAYISKVTYNDTFMQVRMWEMRIYDYLERTRSIIAHSKIRGSSGESFEGGFVLEPVAGVYQWVCSVDAKSLYPSIIMMLNASPETLVKQIPLNIDMFNAGKYDHDELTQNNWCLAINGAVFDKSKKGFIVEMTEDMFNKRSETKDRMLSIEKQMEAIKGDPTRADEYATLQHTHIDLNNTQNAYKINGNSIYGAMGSNAFMYYNRTIAEAITITGQHSIITCSEHLNSYMESLVGVKKRYVVFNDTDSAGLMVNDLVEKYCSGLSTLAKEQFVDSFMSKKVQPMLREVFDEVGRLMNVSKSYIIMKRENICDKMIIIAGKNYIMRVVNKEGGIHMDPPMIKLVGIEAVKSSTPDVCRKFMKEIIPEIFECTEEYFQDRVVAFRKVFDSQPLSEIAKPTGVNDMEKWIRGNKALSGTPWHVHAAHLFNTLIDKHGLSGEVEKIASGDKIKVLRLYKKNPFGYYNIGFKGFMPPQFGVEKYVDMDGLFEATTTDPLQRIVGVMGWTVEKRFNALDDVFG